MTKKAQKIMKEKNKGKLRSESKLEKARDKRKKLAKRYKNAPEKINIKEADTNTLKEEYQKLKDHETSKPGKDIKNKNKRQEIVLMRNTRKKQIKSKIRRNKDENEKNEIKIAKTIDNQREHDETYIENDDEIEDEINNDEFTPYFNGEYDPQIMITTSIRHTSTVFKFIKAIKETIPNTYFYYRKKLDISKMVEFAKEKGFSCLMVVTEEAKKPVRISFCHLFGEGLTLEMKINDIIYREDIKDAALPSDHNPELIFKNFRTKLGLRVQRMFNSLFPKDEELKGRRVITFHNQRDYIFFRHYRYQFEKDLQNVRLQEIGPSFTLRLLSIQKGFFERETQDFEYEYKDQMGVRRRKFYL